MKKANFYMLIQANYSLIPHIEPFILAGAFKNHIGNQFKMFEERL